MRKILRRLGRCLGAMCLAAPLTQAQVEGPSGHYYEVVMEPGLLWEEARERAAESTLNGVHGHLATITSAEEDAFIENLRQQASPGGYGSLWVGGHQISGPGATSGWTWENGEGAIPLQMSDRAYANWQPGEPNDYWGPNSENHLSVGHFNTFGWNDDRDDRYIQGYVVEYPSSGTVTTVRITATDLLAREVHSNTGEFDSATFRITRVGDVSLDLPVFYSIHGTAQNGMDYNEISQSLIIPAGRDSADLVIYPRADVLAVVEPMETVGIRIEPSPILNPSASYYIDNTNREAGVVIIENMPPTRPSVEIGVPRSGFAYQPGEAVNVLALAHGNPAITNISLLSNDRFIGIGHAPLIQGNYTLFKFAWTNPPAGTNRIVARIHVEDQIILSTPVQVIIPGAIERQTVSVRAMEGTQPLPMGQGDVAPGYFEFHRTGPTNHNLQIFYSIGGTATHQVDYDTLQGYVVIGAGRTSARLNIVARDDNEDELTESVVLTVVPPGPTVAPMHPADYDIDVTRRAAEVLIYDDDEPVGPPTISISADPMEISEPLRMGMTAESRVTISRSGPVDAAQMVRLAFQGSAIHGEDYSGGSTTVVIPAGQIATEFLIHAIADALVEPLEFARVRVVPPEGFVPGDNGFYHVGPTGVVDITIRDVPSPAHQMVSLLIMTGITREPSPTANVVPAVVAVRRTGPTNSALAVLLRYSGTATQELDYQSISNVVTIPAGRMETMIRITAKADEIVEGDETVVINLNPGQSDPPPYLVDTNRSMVTVVIQDGNGANEPANVSVETPDPFATELSTANQTVDPARFHIRRDGNLSEDLQIFFSLHGTAKNGVDYESLPNFVVIPAGQSQVALQVVPISQNGNVNHHYEIISAPGVSWEQARQQASQASYQGFNGHLATITSAEEDAYIESLRMQSGGGHFWVGGYQEQDEHSATGGWRWVNNEGSFPGTNQEGVYANWLQGEPNDYWGPASENHLVIGWLNTFGWNDQGANVGAQGYVVEYDVLTPIPMETEPEGMETVTLRLEKPPEGAENANYTVMPENRTTVAVIYEHEAPAQGAVDVAFPSDDDLFRQASEVEFFVAAYHSTADVRVMEYYVDGQKLGSTTLLDTEDFAGGLEIHRFQWPTATTGEHILHVNAIFSNNVELSTEGISFRVQNGGTNQNPVVQIVHPQEGTVFFSGNLIDILVRGTDADGSIAEMELIMDGNIVASTNGPALRYLIATASVGPHTLQARAQDNLGAVGVADTVHILVRHPDAVSFVQRRLPAGYAPGTAFRVELHTDPDDGTHAYAVEDQPPVGWIVSSISHNGVFDAGTGKVKFGPFTDAQTRMLTYVVVPPSNAVGVREFRGQGAMNEGLYPIAGDATIEQVQQYHPADLDKSFSIGLTETTGYAAAWKAGESWATGPVPIPLAYVTRAGSLWKQGEEYVFDPSRGPAPACWVAVSEPGMSMQTRQNASGASRSISSGVQPGVATQIQIAVTPESGIACYAVEEKPPRGWTISNVSHEGNFDASTGTIRWGAYYDGAPRNFTYTATPPAVVGSVGTFSGQISADGKVNEVGAITSVDVAGRVPVQMVGISSSANGITLEIAGAAGQTAVLEASSDFATWIEVQSIYIPDGEVQVTDSSSGEAAARFYRLRVK